MTADLARWQGRPPPGGDVPSGRHVTLRPVRWPDDAEGLFAALGGAGERALYDHLLFGPFASAAELADVLSRRAKPGDVYCRIADHQGAALGLAAFLRVRPEHGSAELGGIVFGPRLSRLPGGTEAIFLMLTHLFDTLGYRRAEWKCDAANARSYAAAERYGFAYEGTFRQDMVTKGRSRDTAWLSITDAEWPALRRAFEAWLSPDNFGADGRQRRSLRTLTAPLRARPPSASSRPGPH